MAAFQQALELWSQLSSISRDIAIGLDDLASVEHLSGDLEGAERDYRDALRIARTIRDTDCVAGCIGRLAQVALDREDQSNAEALSRDALTRSERLGHKRLIGDNCYRLARSLVRQRKTFAAEALLYARRAVEIHTRLGSSGLAEAQATLEECEAALRETGG
jgi:hypothetical protein